MRVIGITKKVGSMADILNQGLITQQLPGNNINANMLGYSLLFTNNSLPDQAAQSLAWFQKRGGVTTPDIIEVLPGENGKPDNTQTQADRDFEKIFEFYRNATPEEIEKAAIELRKVDTIPQSTWCDGFSDENYFGIPFKSFCNSATDVGKRSILVILGILLLILGARFLIK